MPATLFILVRNDNISSNLETGNSLFSNHQSMLNRIIFRFWIYSRHRPWRYYFRDKPLQIDRRNGPNYGRSSRCARIQMVQLFVCPGISCCEVILWIFACYVNSDDSSDSENVGTSSRPFVDYFVQTVAPMQYSGLPCFKGKTLSPKGSRQCSPRNLSLI